MTIRTMVLAVWLCGAVPLVGQAAWQNVPIPGDMQYARVICDTEQYLYCAFETADGEAGGLYRTPSQAPAAWEYLGFSGVRVYDVVEAAGSGPVLLIGTNDANRVYRSTDHGSTWTACGASLPGDIATTLHWDGGSPGRVYCVTRGWGSGMDAISVSTDRGLSWITVHSEVFGTYLTLLSSRGDGSPNVWQTGYTQYWTSPVFRSTDGGQTWSWLHGEDFGWGPPTALCTPGGNQWVYSLVGGYLMYRWNNDLAEAYWTGWGFYGVGMQAPAWWNGRLVVCGVAENGRLSVAHRSEGEETWTSMNEGLPDEISPSPDGAWWQFALESCPWRPVLYFGTSTLGLWRLDLSDIVGVDDTAPLRTSPNLRVLPTPAGTMVRFSMDEVAGYPVELQIVDATGRQVASLRGGKEGTTWNFKDALGRAVPSGTYYVSVRSGSGAASVRFVHVR